MSDTGNEVTRLLKVQYEATKEWKEKQDARLETLEEMMKEVAVKVGRPFGFGQSGCGDKRAETKAFLDLLRTGCETPETKAMMGGSDPQGGYLLPSQLDNMLSKNLRENSPMRQLATVVPVGGTDFKQVHSIGGTGYTWVGETTERPETAAPSLKQLTVPTHEVYAMPGVTQNLLDDNEFDLENWLTEELTEAFSDGESDAFINGNGVARPRGLFTYDVVTTGDATRAHNEFQYIPTGANGAFDATKADVLINLIHAVKPRYRRNAAWLMNGEVLEVVRKMKEATSDAYIWQPGLQAGQPSTLLGFPVHEDENVPAIATGSLSVAFGDFRRAYTITDRSTSLLRDPYTKKPYVMFYSSKRVGGGGGRDTRAVKFLKFSAT